MRYFYENVLHGSSSHFSPHPRTPTTKACVIIYATSRWSHIPWLLTFVKVKTTYASRRAGGHVRLSHAWYLNAHFARAELLTTIESEDGQYSKWKPWLRSVYTNHHTWIELTNFKFSFFSPLIFFEIFNIQLQFLIGFELSSSRAFQICVDHLLTLSGSKVMIGVH